jgi:hypothetical protein
LHDKISSPSVDFLTAPDRAWFVERLVFANSGRSHDAQIKVAFEKKALCKLRVQRDFLPFLMLLATLHRLVAYILQGNRWITQQLEGYSRETSGVSDPKSGLASPNHRLKSFRDH